jgi:uncharacterized membrane protein YGL010W
MHPLCSTIIRRPDLVVDHLSAYAALLTQEAGQASRALVNRALIFAIAVMSGFIFVVLSGIALMLGVLQNQFHWILVAVPGVMALCAISAFAWTKQAVLASHFTNIKSQFLSDAQALRIASGKETQREQP